jgi:hypothetical protein
LWRLKIKIYGQESMVGAQQAQDENGEEIRRASR